jgi:hypothetical protein
VLGVFFSVTIWPPGILPLAAPQLTGGAIQPETSEGEEARSRVGGHIGIHAAF